MIPPLIYRPPSQSLLFLRYQEYRLAVAAHLGYGQVSSLWTADQIVELFRDINEAYRWCLYPSSIPGERIPHTWTFMEQTTTVVTAADDYDYTLPTNFGSFVGRYMLWGSGVSYDPPYRTNDTDILIKRSASTRTGRPECFALRWASQGAAAMQRQEAIFYPTPDAVYTLTYRYAIHPEPISEQNPYPLGGPRMSQLLIEACKAIGELKKNGEPGPQFSVFKSALLDAIQLDKGTNTTPTLGFMRGGGDVYFEQLRGDASYYSGPFNNSPENGSPLYTLVA